MEVQAVRYCLHIQNPFNMNVFDDYESERPFQLFSVGDIVAQQTFAWGAGGDDKAQPGYGHAVRVVGVRRAFAAVIGKDSEPTGEFFDETWVITSAQWLEANYPQH